MPRSDIIFLHAPSVYDFRKKPIFYGPVSDVIPSSPVFEMYPIGFMTISSHLEAAGFRTRICNLAVQMLASERFDAEKKIRSLKADVFAIDLHWMPHAHGAIEIAKIVKKYHPDSKVEFGGLTSSYFCEELIRRPEIDLVMCGDTTEEPTVRMMEAIQSGGDLSKVPNLVWKDASGKVHNNGISHSLEDLDSIRFDYGVMIKNVLRNMDIKGALPWYGWDRLPLTSVFTVRGCSLNCAECGGSNHANGRVVCRKAPAYRSPEKLAEDMDRIQSYLDTPIFIVGDLRQHSMDYADRFLKAVKDRGVENHAVVELFNGAGPEYFRKLDRAFEGGWSIEFSPDSHDEEVRLALGKGYTNEAIELSVRSAFESGCSRFDLFYMTGLPFQTKESAMNSARASKKLWSTVGKEDSLFIYNAPFAPFVDPGSRAFEEPEKWGYRFFARTLEEHRALLDSPSWKHVLSYETRWMTRDDIAETSYDAASELARMEYESGRISPEALKSRTERTEVARALMHRIDDIMKISDREERDSKLWEIKAEGKGLMNSTVCDKNDLDWDAGSIWSNSPRVLRGLIRSGRRS
ncbi:MAG: TIGR04190 family B12-binding domain/radical SAM domain protein [Candidatus Methanoplasma sp.]|jgi:B12-binding domain/radical SAM domain protein|nr:TIGR04190 family B12-binding domain/radical SAM domain protein [Candidatus Methanoplasma sp.]